MRCPHVSLQDTQAEAFFEVPKDQRLQKPQEFSCFRQPPRSHELAYFFCTFDFSDTQGQRVGCPRSVWTSSPGFGMELKDLLGFWGALHEVVWPPSSYGFYGFYPSLDKTALQATAVSLFSSYFWAGLFSPRVLLRGEKRI